jgi:hypothetical protein
MLISLVTGMNDPFTGPASGQYNTQYNMYQQHGATFGYNSNNGYPAPPPPMYAAPLPTFNNGGGYPPPPPMYGSNYGPPVPNYGQVSYSQPFNNSQPSMGSPYRPRALTQYPHASNQQSGIQQNISGAFSQLAVTEPANPPVAVPVFALRDEIGQPIPPQFVIEQNSHVGVLHITQVTLAHQLPALLALLIWVP